MSNVELSIDSLYRVCIPVSLLDLKLKISRNNTSFPRIGYVSNKLKVMNNIILIYGKI